MSRLSYSRTRSWMWLGDRIIRRRRSMSAWSTYGLYPEARIDMPFGLDWVRHPVRCCPFRSKHQDLPDSESLILQGVLLPATPQLTSQLTTLENMQDSDETSFLCRLLRQAHGRVKLRGWKPSLYASNVLPFVQKLLDDGLRTMGVET